MKNIAMLTLGIAIGCTVTATATWAFIHRRAIAAFAKGEPMPEPPAWHKGHPCIKK